MTSLAAGQGDRVNDPLARPLRLPCGAVLANRLCKAAMTEGVADEQLRATPRHETLYRTWSEGGAGLLLTGNVQVHRHDLDVLVVPLDLGQRGVRGAVRRDDAVLAEVLVGGRRRGPEVAPVREVEALLGRGQRPRLGHVEPEDEAVREARQLGIHAGLLRLISIWPFPEEEIKNLASRAKSLIVAEMNLGQISREVERCAGRPVRGVFHAGGAMIPPDPILKAILEASA